MKCFENAISKMVAIMFRYQCVKQCLHIEHSEQNYPVIRNSSNTVKCCYNTVQFIMILHTALRFCEYSGRMYCCFGGKLVSLIARLMGPTWGPAGADRTQVGPMLATWTCYLGSPTQLCWRGHNLPLRQWYVRLKTHMFWGLLRILTML